MLGPFPCPAVDEIVAAALRRGSSVIRMTEAAQRKVDRRWKRNDLLITATSSLYAIRLNVNGVRYPPLRQRG